MKFCIYNKEKNSNHGRILKRISPLFLAVSIISGISYVDYNNEQSIYTSVKAEQKTNDGITLIYPTKNNKVVRLNGVGTDLESIKITSGGTTYIEVVKDPDKQNSLLVKYKGSYYDTNLNNTNLTVADSYVELNLSSVYSDLNGRKLDISVVKKSQSEVKFTDVVFDFNKLSEEEASSLEEEKIKKQKLNEYKNEAKNKLRNNSMYSDLSSKSLRLYLDRIDSATSIKEIDRILVIASDVNSTDRQSKRLDYYKTKIMKEIDALDYLDNSAKNLYKSEIELVSLKTNTYEQAENKIDDIKLKAVSQSNKNTNRAVPIDAIEGDSVIKIRLPKNTAKDYVLTIAINSSNNLNYTVTSSDVSRGYINLDLGYKLSSGDRLMINVYDKSKKLVSDLVDNTYIIPEKSENERFNSYYRQDDRNVVSGNLKLERIFGRDRFKTSIDVARSAFTKGSDTVVLANSSTYYDILGAMSFADYIKAPILYTNRDFTPDNIMNTIKLLKAKKIVVIGGENSISSAQYDDLKMQGYTMERIGGVNRYDTSVKLAEKLISSSGRKSIVIASSSNYADALSVSAYAFKEEAPILLVDKNFIPQETRLFLSKYSPSLKITIVGGKNSVSDEIEKDLDKYTKKYIKRLSGNDRYETSTAIAKELKLDSKNAIVTSGENYVDALVSGGLVRKYDAPILLVEKNSLPYTIINYLRNSKIDNIIIVGGTGSVSDNVQIKIGNIK